LVDIIRHLGTDSFPRLKIGIDRPPPEWDVADYVLGKFAKHEQDEIEAATTRAAQAAIDWATDGTTEAMNRYNADPRAQSAPPKRTEPRPSRTADKSNPNSKTSKTTKPAD
jgi:PTH1 family peptidyl-tRNA hydrolase